MNKKVNIPQKDAGRKWAQRLKELSQQRPPQDLVDKLNQTEDKAKVAKPAAPQKALEV